MKTKFFSNFKWLLVPLMLVSLSGVAHADLWKKRAIVSINDYAIANSWVNATAYGTINLNDDVTATGGGTGNNKKYYSTAPGTWRFYQTGDGSITIETTNGTLNSVTFVFSKSNNGTISYSSSALTSKTACAVSGTSATFNISATSGTTGQILISFIIVEYTPTKVTDIFNRISSPAELAHGDDIIFVNQAETHACGTQQNSNNRTPVAISVSDHTYIYSGSDNVQVFTVMKNNDGEYGFFANGGFIHAREKNQNILRTSSFDDNTVHRVDSITAWSLSADSYVFTALNGGGDGFSTYYLAFNGTSYFSRYALGQTKPYIYKRLEELFDIFIDEMHDNSIAHQAGSYTMPDLSDETPGSYCVGQHYNFLGWVAESDLNTDGTLKSGYTLYAPGTAMEADLTTYYAIWDIE